MKNKTQSVKEETLYDKWFDIFGWPRDVRLQFSALYRVLVANGVIDETACQKQWHALMEYDLTQIRKNLEAKAKSKKSKPPFHSAIFSRFKRFIFGRFLNNVITR